MIKHYLVPACAAIYLIGTLHLSAQTNTIQLRTNGTNSATLRAASSGGHLTFTLPGGLGTTGQVLTSSDGTGTLSWTTVSGGGGGLTTVAVDTLTDAKSGGANFTNSLILGHQTTGTLTNAERNTALGYASLDAITTGDDNLVVGFNAGTALNTGGTNTLIGSGAGATLSSHSGNVFIGFQAGGNASVSNQLYIDNTNTSTPLIHGDFSTDAITINGTLRLADYYGFKVPSSHAFFVADFFDLDADVDCAAYLYSDANGTQDEITFLNGQEGSIFYIIYDRNGLTGGVGDTQPQLDGVTYTTTTELTAFTFCYINGSWRCMSVRAL